MRRRVWVLGCCGLLLGIVFWPAAGYGGGGPKNVLLVINENSAVSQSIGAYYQQKRGIPGRNVCRIHCSTSELVSKSECETNIVAPIRSFIDSSGLHDRIDYIVLTKGVPLQASYDDAGWWGPVSVSSVLTCVGEPSIVTPYMNPYGPMASPAAPDQYFTHLLSFSGKSYYAVTRLDAYTEEQVHRMIDDSLAAQMELGLFLLDGRYEFQPWSQYYKANDRLRTANHDLQAAGYMTYYDDTTFDSMINEFVGGQQGLMGYFSWGSNEDSYSLAAYTSNQFAPGSIADSFVSTSARTFTHPPTYGQSLIADLIPQGLSAGTGYVSEPGVSLTTHPNVLFDRYVRGYNVAESFLAATPRLYWKGVTVGDPLMAPYATPPVVAIDSPDPARIAHGIETLSASATDESGIGKVEFYIDDYLVATCTGPPYQFSWDTSQYSEGSHVLEAIAYEDSSVFTQGSAMMEVEVRNEVLEVESIGELESVPDGRLVRLDSKIVVAGTDAFSDCVYLSEPDRSAGIKVVGLSDIPTDAVLTVEGELTLIEGEQVILASWSEIEFAPAGGAESDEFKPLSMPNRSVGNTGLVSLPEYSALISGLSNTGLLIRTWGRVMQTGEDEFDISDRSLDFKLNTGWRVVNVSLKNLTTPISMPPMNSFVVVVGISCYVMEDGLLKPTVRPRTPEDVTVISP